MAGSEGRVKYPRTSHLPWSPGFTSDDKVQRDLSAFADAEVIVSEKRDGANVTIGRDYCHGRSLDSGHHPSRAHVKALAARVGPDLPAGWRVCGENLAAVHSIRYDDLPGYFEAFSVWDGQQCLSWDLTVEWCALLDLTVVPVLYRGPMPSQAELHALWQAGTAGRDSEGYVVRLAAGFDYADFGRSVCKFVRRGHVQTGDLWKVQEMTLNGLAAGATGR